VIRHKQIAKGGLKSKKRLKKVKNISLIICNYLQTFVYLLNKQTLKHKQNDNFKQQHRNKKQRQRKSQHYRLGNYGLGNNYRPCLWHAVRRNRILIMKKAIKVLAQIIYTIIALSPIFFLGYLLGLTLLK
jgi:hypothetical protein